MQDRVDQGFKSPVFSSPYLNFDPSILNPAGSSQFIIPEGQEEHRGKMEMAFFTIGGSLSVGAFLGGMNGLFTGLNETRNLSGSIRYSQLINFVAKRGSTSSQTFGGIALMFSLYDWMLSSMRSVDDEVNIAASGLLTGVTYTSPHGLKRMVKGGIVGLGLTLAYLGYTRREQFFGPINSSSNKSY